jgi:hypothetical protein
LDVAVVVEVEKEEVEEEEKEDAATARRQLNTSRRFGLCGLTNP